MSLSLLKQSMDLLEEDLPQSTKKYKAKEAPKKKSNLKQKSKPYPSNTTTTFDGQQPKQKAKLQDIRRELNQGARKANENMRRLLALSQNTVKVADAEKIVKRAHKGRYVDVELPKVEQQSIFTEEDFRAFEEEYFQT